MVRFSRDFFAWSWQNILTVAGRAASATPLKPTALQSRCDFTGATLREGLGRAAQDFPSRRAKGDNRAVGRSVFSGKLLIAERGDASGGNPVVFH